MKKRSKSLIDNKMLYFAYGSNLNHFQMKRRCKDSVFLKSFNLRNFELNFRSKYRAADIEVKKSSVVQGALFEISKSDEKKLDIYEDYPILYKKYYFTYYGKKVMTYTMTKKTSFRFPTERYLNVIKKGYKDCSLDEKYLNKVLTSLAK
tara:strand:- start:3793 stop:4239 length:447 start_codon:yes stop_codon:yes gene_type:complete